MPLGRRQQVATVGVAAVATALALAACSSSSSSSTPSSSSSATSSASSSSSSAALSGTLNGSGSTFQLTFQQEAISSFKSVQPGMTVNYSGVGSGKGRSNLAAGTVNFAGSDSTIPASEASTFKGTVLYFPVVIGPITVSYNLSGLSKPLQLSAPVIADIFQAKITTWNNSAIAADNPGVTLPSTAITICRRSDSSGTTQNFSEFLVKGRAERLDARLQLDHQVARRQPRRQRQRRGGVLHQEHLRGRRVRGLRRRQGLRADLRCRSRTRPATTSRRRRRRPPPPPTASPSRPT